MMDVWICDFTSVLTVFHSYQDNEFVIMKDCRQWNPVFNWRDSRLEQVSNTGPLDQHAST